MQKWQLIYFFKEGDRIKIISAPDLKGCDSYAGTTGEIIEIYEDGGFCMLMDQGGVLVVPSVGLKQVKIRRDYSKKVLTKL